MTHHLQQNFLESIVNYQFLKEFLFLLRFLKEINNKIWGLKKSYSLMMIYIYMVLELNSQCHYIFKF